jgi:vacuolar-type H+-ATPase subunit C/Vma6
LIGKDLEAIRCALADSSYSEQISAVPQDILDYSFLETALLQNYAVTIQKLIKFSSGNIKKLLLAFSKKLEISNVKAMLRAFKAQINVDEAMKHIIPVGTLDVDRCRGILDAAKSVEDVIRGLTDFEYDVVLKHAVEERGDDLTQLEVALDRAVYREILEKSENLTGVDKKIVKDVLGIELDAANVKIILKSKELTFSQETVKDYLMPTAFLDEETLKAVMKAPNLKNMVKRLCMIVEKTHPVYEKVFTQMAKEDTAPLSRLETILDKAQLEMSLFVLKEHSRYYNIGFVLAFLNLKWAEVKNLRCIIKGAERKMPTSQVRKLLTIPNEWKESQMIHRPS